MGEWRYLLIIQDPEAITIRQYIKKPHASSQVHLTLAYARHGAVHSLERAKEHEILGNRDLTIYVSLLTPTRGFCFVWFRDRFMEVFLHHVLIGASAGDKIDVWSAK